MRSLPEASPVDGLRTFFDPAHPGAHYGAVRARLYNPPPMVLLPPPEAEKAPDERIKPLKPKRRAAHYAPINFLGLPGSKFLLQYIAAKHAVSLKEIIGRRRFMHIVRARHAAICLIKRHRPWLSLLQIGRPFGGLDHTTVLHVLTKCGVIVPDTPPDPSSLKDQLLVPLIDAPISIFRRSVLWFLLTKYPDPVLMDEILEHVYRDRFDGGTTTARSVISHSIAKINKRIAGMGWKIGIAGRRYSMMKLEPPQ